MRSHTFEQMLSEHDKEGLCAYYLSWMKGRWHLISGQYQAALGHYEKAVDGALYRSGGTQRDVLKEALVLAAELGKLPLYKRLKHRAIVFGLETLPPVSKTQIADRKEMAKWAVSFFWLFPPQSRFPAG